LSVVGVVVGGRAVVVGFGTVACVVGTVYTGALVVGSVYTGAFVVVV
jgi:hypothetical protein